MVGDRFALKSRRWQTGRFRAFRDAITWVGAIYSILGQLSTKSRSILWKDDETPELQQRKQNVFRHRVIQPETKRYQQQAIKVMTMCSIGVVALDG